MPEIKTTSATETTTAPASETTAVDPAKTTEVADPAKDALDDKKTISRGAAPLADEKEKKSFLEMLLELLGVNMRHQGGAQTGEFSPEQAIETGLKFAEEHPTLARLAIKVGQAFGNINKEEGAALNNVIDSVQEAKKHKQDTGMSNPDIASAVKDAATISDKSGGLASGMGKEINKIADKMAKPAKGTAETKETEAVSPEKEKGKAPAVPSKFAQQAETRGQTTQAPPASALPPQSRGTSL